MSPRHAVRTAGDAVWGVPPALEGHVRGFRRWTVIDEAAGAVHTGFGLTELDPGGRVDWHVHSFEETVYVLEGEVVLRTSEWALRLVEGDYAMVPIGTPHVLANESSAVGRLASLSAPQPRPAHDGDTYWIPPMPEVDPAAVDVRDPRTRAAGHISPENMDPEKQTQDLLTVSASARTALLVYSGITLKMMVDTDLGAQLSTMFMVQNEELGGAGRHDHPFEEVYFILEGVVDGEFDGETYRLQTGDIAWAGVGCVHAFSNPGPGRVRWLETQVPAPPARHSYRFARDWEYLRDAIAAQEEEAR